MDSSEKLIASLNGSRKNRRRPRRCRENTENHVMKILKLLRAALLVVVLSSFSNADVPGQEKTLLPPELNQSSSLTEILAWLDKNAFPYAQVGLRTKGGHAPSVVPFKSGNPIPAQERIFSEGFHVKVVNDCQVTLSNEQVTIIDARNRSSGSFYRFITQKNGERQLTPQLAMVFLPLNRMSDKRGKGPHLLNKDHEYAKSVGTWWTSYEQEGFFKKSIFDVELTAAEQSQTKELAHFEYLTFTFETKELAQQFDATFRQAIKICASK